MPSPKQRSSRRTLSETGDGDGGCATQFATVVRSQFGLSAQKSCQASSSTSCIENSKELSDADNPQGRRDRRIGAGGGSICLSSWDPTCSSSRNGIHSSQQAQKDGRTSKSKASSASEARASQRERRRGGRRRWRRSCGGFRRVWRARSGRGLAKDHGACYCQTDSHSIEACRPEGQEQDRKLVGRRQWWSRWRRRQLSHGQQEECCRHACSAEVLGGRSEVSVQGDGSPFAERLSIQANSTWRADGSWNHSQRMACSSLQNSELPQSCQMDVASSWNLGQPHQPALRRSPGEMRPPGCSSRSGEHRRWLMGDVECCSLGGSSSLPELCLSSSSKSARAPAQCSLRSSMGRDVSGALEGGRFLCGREAEVRQWKGSAERDVREQQQPAESQSQGESQRERRQGPKRPRQFLPGDWGKRSGL
eukprot:s255_g27.t1